jgi:hypothetical protein
MKLSEKRTSIFQVDYSDDVFAAGRISTNLWDNPMKLKDLELICTIQFLSK